MQTFDLVIIGGGINGASCAADAAVRGLSVLLCEQDDLASKTSSSSSQLIHGGLRYLESYDFSLVKKSLDEQQILMSIAPHAVHKLPLILPHTKKHRSMWLLRIGLFIYDHLSRINTLPNSKVISRKMHAKYFEFLKTHLTRGFLFYDCTADDARLTILNALQAKKHGAQIHNYTKLTHAVVENNHWILTLKPQHAPEFKIKSCALLNASGPWLAQLSTIINQPLKYALRLVKGSHIVIPKIYNGDHAYVLQHNDQRIIFVMPFHGFTMIGTTEIAYTDALEKIHITPDEIEYLCNIVNEYFKRAIHPSDIIHTWSGVRPLVDKIDQNSRKLSREHAIDFTKVPAPLLTLYGGKITTHRQVGISAIDHLRSIFPHLKNSQTINMPGATCGSLNLEEYKKVAKNNYAWLPKGVLQHYLDVYGTLTEKILENCHNIADLGECFSPLLYQREIDYLIQEEWAKTTDDILWRRTKLGLTLDVDAKNKLAKFMV